MALFKKKVPGGFLGKILHFVQWLEWGVKVISVVITALRNFPPVPQTNTTDEPITDHTEVETDS